MYKCILCLVSSEDITLHHFNFFRNDSWISDCQSVGEARVKQETFFLITVSERHELTGLNSKTNKERQSFEKRKQILTKIRGKYYRNESN